MWISRFVGGLFCWSLLLDPLCLFCVHRCNRCNSFTCRFEDWKICTWVVQRQNQMWCRCPWFRYGDCRCATSDSGQNQSKLQLTCPNSHKAFTLLLCSRLCVVLVLIDWFSGYQWWFDHGCWFTSSCRSSSCARCHRDDALACVTIHCSCCWNNGRGSSDWTGRKESSRKKDQIKRQK